MKTRIWKAYVVILTACAAVVAALALPSAASALPLTTAQPGTYLTYNVGTGTLYIGAVAHDAAGLNYYCIEAGEPVEYETGPAAAVPDSDDTRRLSWLMDRYRDSSDALTHAAIGLLVHDRYDLHQEVWQRHKEVIVRLHADIEARSQELWQESGLHAPASANIAQRYAQGKRQGNVEISVSNAAGSAIADVPYTARIEGPAVFEENGKTTVSGQSQSRSFSHTWKAIGAGKVTVSLSYQASHLDQITNGQDTLRFGGSQEYSGSAVNFEVRKDFMPTLSTVTSAKTVDAGQPVSDTVTSGVQDANSVWVPNLELEAQGWYIDGLHPEDLDKPIAPQTGERATNFLKRLEKLGFKPAGYAHAKFTGPGQSVTVEAKTADGGQSYHAPVSGGFGTWVWAFEREKLSKQAQEYVLADAVSPFLEIVETNSNRAQVQVQSTVTEHSVSIGSELSDTITVTGFPNDHGSFARNKEFGFGADNPYAQVSVWWSGDPENQDNDVQYRPQGASVPDEDEHHVLVGTWDYPASNGVLRVGAGAPDAHGNPVHIMAESHGWYVFVWQFSGDDRVMPAASTYDDAWERTRVEDFVHKRPLTITTAVDKERVAVDEPFKDAAQVIGDVPEGAYVEFTAYEAIGKGEKPGLNAKLLDSQRVELNHRLDDQRVTSETVHSGKPGFVYWQAAVFSPDGDVLATHELGVDGEIVEVVEKPEVPDVQPKKELAQTGANITVLVVVVAAALLTAIVTIAAIRRRSL